MSSNDNMVRKYLKEFDLKKLFIEELGWNDYSQDITIKISDGIFNLKGVAEKCGMAVFLCINGVIPEHSIRCKIETESWAFEKVWEYLIKI